MRKLRVGFIEFYRQWPGYFTDTFNAAYAGALSEAGHDARIFRIFLHERSQEVILEAHQALTAAGPFDVLVFDRVWDGALLRDVVTAAGAPHVLVLQWESSAQWPEVTARISPISRDALLAYAEAIATDVAPTSECIPNLFTRDENGAWRPPKSLVPLEIKRELRAPLTLGHDRAAHFGLPEEAYRRTRYLVLNMGCPYRGAENTSDFLDGLDLPTSWGAAGCTFCNVGPYERQRREERLALMENQLAALALHGDYDRLVVQDEYIFRDLDTLVEVVMRHAAAPSAVAAPTVAETSKAVPAVPAGLTSVTSAALPNRLAEASAMGSTASRLRVTTSPAVARCGSLALLDSSERRRRSAHVRPHIVRAFSK